MRVSTVLRVIVLVSIIIDEAISAYRFLKAEGSYMWVSTFYCILNEAISACRLLLNSERFLSVAEIEILNGGQAQ